MARYLPRCVGGVTLKSWEPRVVQYLTTVLDRGSKELGRRNQRELRTLAEALDHLLEGDPLKAADVLMARFSSVELAGPGQSRAVAQHLEFRRKLRAIADAADHLSEGDPRRAADALRARLSSVELAGPGQSWAVAQHLELVPEAESGVASERAKHAAGKEELLRQKLLATLGGKAAGRDGGQRKPQPRYGRGE